MKKLINGIIAVGIMMMLTGCMTSEEKHYTDNQEKNHLKVITAIGEEDTEDSEVYYYLEGLEGEKRDAYRLLVKGIEEFEENIELPISDVQTLKEIYYMVYADHPELFWMDSGFSYTLYEHYVELQPHYNCSQEKMEKKQEKIAKALKKAGNHHFDSDYETAKSIFTYLIDLIEYDIDASDSQNIYSALVKNETVCAGYARATQYLLQLNGIKALYVSGEADGAPHGWVIAECDGAYYHIDTTYGDPNYILEEDALLPDEMTYDFYYLCCDDNNIMSGRVIDDDLPVPVCDSEIYNYHLLNNTYFTEYSEVVEESVIESIRSGEKYYSCQFADDEAFNEMKEAIDDGLYPDLILEYGSEDYESIMSWYTMDEEKREIRLWY